MITRNKGKRLNRYVKDYVVFDLETTGINQEIDAIIEISAIKVCDNEIAGQYSTLVNPARHIPAGATAVNGITDEMVSNAPDIKEAIGGFAEFISGNILVGHNIHTFDTNFAYDALYNHWSKEMNNDYVDTLYLARKCLPQLSHHKLTDVSRHFRIETAGAHRALNDCIMNQRCYEELGKIMQTLTETEPERECPVCGSSLIKRKGKFGEFYGCESYPGCRFTMNIR
ncbi:3'-5' exonuclease [Kineothrix sp. MB12-C1]|uniref:3'-5' exonuclease n=1 Tax=Kineothrix sp. MB12-C1 TaxID=3070215 RepID=UPI0027D2BB1F|nr:exonuclease domain-containing protein [Kineothrix sp. MB12-C1]WMC94023.1 exonuclease domain-containing protein [Kineothrix sp. MB12-C1]